MNIQALLGFAGVIGCTVGGNLLLKTGAMAPSADRVFLGLIGLTSLAGLALFGVGGLAYAILLRSVPLNVAQVFLSAQFIVAIVASYAILGEPVSPLRWAGIGFTAVGIAIVGATTFD